MEEPILRVFIHHGNIHDGVDAINDFVDEHKKAVQSVYPHGIQYIPGTPGKTVLYYELRE